MANLRPYELKLVNKIDRYLVQNQISLFVDANKVCESISEVTVLSDLYSGLHAFLKIELGDAYTEAYPAYDAYIDKLNSYIIDCRKHVLYNILPSQPEISKSELRIPKKAYEILSLQQICTNVSIICDSDIPDEHLDSGSDISDRASKLCENSSPNTKSTNDLVLKVDFAHVDHCNGASVKRTPILIENVQAVTQTEFFNLNGVAFLGSVLPEHLSNEDKSINTTGLQWFPEEDVISLKVDELDFFKKLSWKKTPNLDGILPRSKIHAVDTLLPCGEMVATMLAATPGRVALMKFCTTDFHLTDSDDNTPHSTDADWIAKRLAEAFHISQSFASFGERVDNIAKIHFYIQPNRFRLVSSLFDKSIRNFRCLQAWFKSWLTSYVPWLTIQPKFLIHLEEIGLSCDKSIRNFRCLQAWFKSWLTSYVPWLTIQPKFLIRLIEEIGLSREWNTVFDPF